MELESVGSRVLEKKEKVDSCRDLEFLETDFHWSLIKQSLVFTTAWTTSAAFDPTMKRLRHGEQATNLVNNQDLLTQVSLVAGVLDDVGAPVEETEADWTGARVRIWSKGLDWPTKKYSKKGKESHSRGFQLYPSQIRDKAGEIVLAPVANGSC